MKRLVRPEILDSLAPDDPRAIRARRDLKRVNWWMGNRRILRHVVQQQLSAQPPGRIMEIGAGDGQFFLAMISKLSLPWPQPRASLLDRQDAVTPPTRAAFARLGWQVDAVVADVFDEFPPGEPIAVVVANLFVHQFEDEALARLLGKVAGQTDLFIAVEPHRFAFPWPCGQLLRLIGCSSVTVHDAIASIRGGFIYHELTELWPEREGWELTERRAGCFSHLFIARRRR